MTDYARVISGELNIDWDFDTSYTDESAYEISAAGQLRLAPPETAIWSPRGIVDRMSVQLRNETGRFSPLNTGGALYSDLQDGGAYHAPIYQRISIDGGSNYYRVFSGVIKIPQEGGSNVSAVNGVNLDCRSADETLLTKRISTSGANFVARHAAGLNEAQQIAYILQDAGLTGSDYELDDGLFPIPWAWLDDESPIEACWALAAACGGRFYARPDGLLVYENATHWLLSPHDTSQATLDRSAAQRFQPSYNDAELYQSITVEAIQRSIGLYSAAGWASDAVLTVPASTTGSDYVILWAELDDPAFSIGSATYDALSSGGFDLSASVSVVQTNYAQRVELKFQNSHATLAAEIQNLAIPTILTQVDDAIELTAVSSDSFWNDREGRTRRLSGNRWIQTQQQLSFLAEFLRDRHEMPRLFWKIEGYRGDPERRLGDRLTVDDSSIMSSSRDVFATAIDWRFDKNGFRQNIEAVDAATLYTYIDSDPTYFIIGTDTLGAGSSSPGRVFY